MAEWLFEAGIGEARAALVENGRIVEARIEVDDGALRVGAVLPARLVETGPHGGVVAVEGGLSATLTHIPPRTPQGSALLIEIVREAIPEPGRVKLAKAVAAPADAVPTPSPDLLARITASGVPVRRCLAHEPDRLEAAGWSEVLDEALSGEIVFAGGALRMSPTPAMTLFDVDGPPPATALALAAAPAVADAIRRHGIGGSIGIDFPTLEGRAVRQAIAEAFDARLPPPFERTAVNGFGFLQVIRPRRRASLPELLRADSVAAAARAALRMIERTPPGSPGGHRVPPAVRARLMAEPEWLAELTRRTGVVPVLES